MSFNLIEQKWIPVRTNSGRRMKIAPWEITEGYATDPIAALDAPRPDFNGALIQFLIGLAQTCAAAEDRVAWKERLRDPPEPGVLHDSFKRVSNAFDLDGDGPRFMQDLELREGQDWPVAALLIDLTSNDHFLSSGVGGGFCFLCAAAALHCLQTNAPEGGRGHFTSLRGGGPLTTLAVPEKERLWETVWLNTITSESFLGGWDAGNGKDSDIFPWLAPTRKGERKEDVTTPVDVHPAQMFWGMPRRIRLNFSRADSGRCDVCREYSDTLITQYISRPHGIRYGGPWKHPLTPYRSDKQRGPLPLHARPGGITYRHWLGFIRTDPVNAIEPALIIFTRREDALSDAGAIRVRAFGYDMDHMRAKCWYEGTMPLPRLSEEIRDDFDDAVERIIRGATQIARNLVRSMKEAWFKRPSDARGDMGFVDSVFWRETEAGFYTLLTELQQLLEADQEIKPVIHDWHETLCGEALRLFDEFATSGPIEDGNPKRIALARNKLNRFNRSKNVVRDILQLDA